MPLSLRNCFEMTGNILRKLQRPWYNWPFAKSCLINIFNDFKTTSYSHKHVSYDQANIHVAK